MFRELTKSALSFSWALSLLGVKQALNLGRQQNGGGDLFAPVTQVAVGQLDESLKGMFRSGDNFQARAVDMAFSWMNPANWANPSTWTDMGNWVNPSNWMSSFTILTRAATGGCSGSSASSQSPQGS